MAHNVSHPRPSSADFSPRLNSSSILTSILPSAVKSRLPRLPSLRRSVSMYGIPTGRKGSSSAPGSGARTPEAGFGNAMVLTGRVDEDLYFAETTSDEDLTTAARRAKRGQILLDEGKSGIGWKYANQGLNLLSLAVEESSSISQDSQFGNPSFARQLYIHALTYLLRALPVNLTTEEQLSVRSALPSGVVEPLRLEINPASSSSSNPTSQPSLLHRTLASTIIQMFILFQFVLPYIKYLLRAAYRYDREHKISEKIVAQGLETVDKVGKGGIGIAGVVFGLGDGKVGQMVTDATTWFVEGITGGIHEGVGEGMAIMGVRRSVESPVR